MTFQPSLSDRLPTHLSDSKCHVVSSSDCEPFICIREQFRLFDFGSRHLTRGIDLLLVSILVCGLFQQTYRIPKRPSLIQTFGQMSIASQLLEPIVLSFLMLDRRLESISWLRLLAHGIEICLGRNSQT